MIIIKSDVDYDDIEIGDELLWARVLPKYGTYDIYELKIRTKTDIYCVGSEKDSHMAFSFGKEYAEEVLFKDRKLACKYLKEKKKENKNIKIAEE